MKFLGKVCLKIVLKVRKNQGLAVSLEDTFFEKPPGGGQIDPPPSSPHPNRFRVKIIPKTHKSSMVGSSSLDATTC